MDNGRLLKHVSGTLEIELTEAPERLGSLSNLRAPENARIADLRFVAKLFEDDGGVTPAHWSPSVVPPLSDDKGNHGRVWPRGMDRDG